MTQPGQGALQTHAQHSRLRAVLLMQGLLNQQPLVDECAAGRTRRLQQQLRCWAGRRRCSAEGALPLLLCCCYRRQCPQFPCLASATPGPREKGASAPDNTGGSWP
eukprot:COSAG01_NODE_812_length_13409_cov_20.449812_10_plen_106_part_00